MNKILKIGGIAFFAIIVLFAIALVFSGTFSRSSNKSTLSGALSTGITGKGVSPSSLSLRSEEMAVVPSTASDEVAISQDLPVAEKKIIKNGNLDLKVDNADKAAEKISEVAKNNKGEIFSSSFYQTKNNVKSGTITIKVPVANFEKTFAEVKKVAALVVRESITGQDVTEEYVDLQAQIKNRQAEEQSYIKILDRALKISDILEITQQLSIVRGNIEQLQGRIKYLESQTDMSTISANLTEDENITIIDSWRPWQVIKESFSSLIKGLQGLVDFLIRLIIILIPFLLVWAVIIWAVYRAGKKIYLKIKNRNSQ